MKRYTIQCGSHRYSEIAKDPATAVTFAFKKRPPRYPGILTRAKVAGGVWHYLSTASLLKAAGFKVSP